MPTGVIALQARSERAVEHAMRRRSKVKKILAASLASLGFLALAACTEGDPGMAPDQPLEQTDPMATPDDTPPAGDQPLD
jgi:hypothetical protein